ncbi:hypothetical protein [Dyadobacter sp. BHUBP1]|uniref:hypothetical protein n=1 Tax=Dyadobacter sp. BHUBP1 TaxID=3424178 RepID=UPI003D33442A
MIVRKSCKPDVCSPWIDLIKELLCAGKPACKLAFGQAIVSQKTVTIVAQHGNGSLEYSIDGVLFQDSPTFLNQPCGNHKYFVREKSNSACIAAGYAFIACDCIPEWKNTEEPPLTQCINGKVHSYQTDGCGNFDYKLTNDNCPPPCVPVWVDVAPQETQCVGGKIQVKIQDGCGSFGWRLTKADCNVCVAPQVPQATISQASCLNGSPAGDAGIHFAGVSAADRYGYSQGAIYSGAAYAQAQAMPVGGNLDITGLAGSGQDNTFVFRFFNGGDGCFTDREAVIPALNCPPQCVTPTFDLDKEDPTCNGGPSNNDGKLLLQNVTGGVKYQPCQDTTFTCAADFANAPVIAGPGPVTVYDQIGFFADQPYKDFAVRVYATEFCFETKTLRFYNPCGPEPCLLPAYQDKTASSATCTSGGMLNNDAWIKITGIANATKYGYSVGVAYSGPDFNAAEPLIASELTISNLDGSGNDTSYMIRLFNLAGDCFLDVAITVIGGDCQTPNCCDMIITSIELTD